VQVLSYTDKNTFLICSENMHTIYSEQVTKTVTSQLICSYNTLSQSHTVWKLVQQSWITSSWFFQDIWQWKQNIIHTSKRFTALFPGPAGWAGARRELLDFMVQGKINRGRHTNQPAGCHSIRTNQCSPPPSPISLHAGCPSCRPTDRQCQSTEGLAHTD